MINNLRGSFLVKNRMIKPMGMSQQSGRSIGIMPIGTHKKVISKHLGNIKGGGSPALLLSHDLGSSSIGSGFGVKSPNPNLINKLENLSIGNKPKRNVRLIL